MMSGYALITGASKGIGKAMAECCAKKGINLALVSLPGEQLDEVAWDLAKRFKIKAKFFEQDLSLPQASKNILKWSISERIQVTILINNAGIGYEGNFEDNDSLFYDSLIKVNTLAPTLITREFLPLLKRQPQAYILNTSSFASFYPMPFKVIYAASKSFITGFSEGLSEELKNTNVSVSVVCPAGVDSFAESSSRIEEIGWITKVGRLTPQNVAEIAIEGMLKKKRKIIPGRMNSFIYYLTRFIPTRFKIRLIYKWLCKFNAKRQDNKAVSPKIERCKAESIDA